MTSITRYVTRQRPEADLNSRWGIYSLEVDRWLDVHFTLEKEARAAIRVVEQVQFNVGRPDAGAKHLTRRL
jgi:hypothetical protein